MLRLKASTSGAPALRTLKVTAGTMQIVGLRQRIGVDVQGKHRRVDGKCERDHGFILLSVAEAAVLRDAICEAIDAASAAIAGQCELPLLRRAA